MTANREVRIWLNDVANVRIHGTTRQRPLDLLREEQSWLQPIPPIYTGDSVAARPKRQKGKNLKSQSKSKSNYHPYTLQHSLTVYQQLLEPTAFMTPMQEVLL